MATWVKKMLAKTVEKLHCMYCKDEGYLELFLLGPVPCPLCAPDVYEETEDVREVRSRSVPVLGLATLSR